MNFWKVILATIVIFGAGVFTGGLLVDNIDRSHPRNSRRSQMPAEIRSQTNKAEVAHAPEPSRPHQPDLFNKQFVQQLDGLLQLTPDQRASIQKIIADGQERNHSIWTNDSAQMHMVIQDVQHRVRETLTADQQKQFEELMKPHPQHRPQNTNAPTSLLLPPPLAVSNLSPESQVIFMKAYSNMPPQVREVMIEAERLKAEQETNPPSMILPPTPMGPPNAPAN